MKTRDLNVSRPTRSRRKARPATRNGDLKSRAYEELKRQIIAGELSSGEILSESRLAESLSMSKTPVRVALDRLELEGLIRVIPQRGIVVRELTDAEVEDQFQLRLVLEGFALRSMAGRLSRGEVKLVNESLLLQEEAARAGDVARTVELDTEFHMLFCGFPGNQEIVRILGLLRDRINFVKRRVFQRSDPERLFESLREHRGIARALINGKADLAVKRLEKHLAYGLPTRRTSGR